MIKINQNTIIEIQLKDNVIFYYHDTGAPVSITLSITIVIDITCNTYETIDRLRSKMTYFSVIMPVKGHHIRV